MSLVLKYLSTRKISILFAIICFIFQVKLCGQTFKFGEPYKEAFNNVKFEDDTSNTAVILYDSANTYFSAIREQFTIITEQFKRIKIISDKSENEGEIVIERYGGEYFEKYEPLVAIKGFSHRIGKNNEIITKKLDSTDIFITANTIKIFFPKVKKGTIIEYHIIVEEPATANLIKWNFQERNPIIRSVFKIEIPEYFNVAAVTRGKSLIISENLGDSLYSNPKNQIAIFRELGSQTKIKVKRFKYSMDNIEGRQNEPFVLNLIDEIPAMDFHLYELKIKDTYLKLIDTWTEYSEKYGKSDNLLFSSSRIERLNKFFPITILPDISEREKINIIVRHVKNTIQWNGIRSENAQNDVFKLLDLKKGSSAEVNLVLLAFLKAKGFEAYPAIISSRGRGVLNVKFPDKSQLNQMVVAIKYNDSYVFRDATDKYLSDDILPLDAYNGDALIPIKENPLFVNLSADYLQLTEKTHHEIQVESDTSVNIKASITLHLFDSAKVRKELEKEKSSAGIKKWLDYNANYPSDSMVIENQHDIQEALRITLYKKLTDTLKSDSIQVFYLGQLNTNPLKSDKRFSDIQFTHSIKETITSTVEFADVNMKFKTPARKLINYSDNGIIFQYEINTIENKVSVMSRRVINKTKYEVTSFKEIQTLYTDIIAKQHEPIIILP